MALSRRTFLHTTTRSTVSALSFPYIVGSGLWGTAPSNQLNIGLIGCRGRGFRVLRQHLDLGGINCIALCDVDDAVLQEKQASLQTDYRQKPNLYKDFRKLLENKDLDAVIVGTPDHWHCLQMVAACEAGIDVYVEKPMANSIAECEVMVQAARRYNRIVQVGQQQRSGKVWKEVMDFMKAGNLGHIRKTNIWANFNYGLGPLRRPDGEVPTSVGYDMYLGPAPKRPFNPSRFHGGWRHFWDYGGGLMTDFGAHLIDMALWVKDITTPPATVMAYGSQLDRPELAKETYDTMTAIFPLGDYEIQWESNAGIQTGPYGKNYGLAFLGDKGTLVVNRSGWEVIPEWDGEQKTHKMEPFTSEKYDGGHDLHIRDFVACVKERKKPAADPAIGKNVALYAHMANIAVRSGEGMLHWNAEKQRFSNSKAANDLIKPEYRKPWKFPHVS